MAISNNAATPAATGSHAGYTPESVYRKVTIRVVPLILICYFFGYLDRVNVGFAKLQMMSDLTLSETAYGVGAGLFFIGYLLLQVPAGFLIKRIGIRACLAGSMLSWGVVSIATLLTRDQTTFYAFRFLLGLTEASFFPAVIAYFGVWFPSFRLSKVMSYLFLAMPLGVIIGAPLSGWIMDATHGSHGLAGWQWMFLLEGLPAVLLGVVLFIVLADQVSAARWLSPAEASLIQGEIARESTDKKSALLPALKEPTLWLLFVISFLYNIGNYGLVFWLPSMVKALGKLTNFQTGLISAIPYLVAAVAMVVNAQHSVRSRERRWHTAIPVFIGGVALLASVAIHGTPAIAIACLTVAVAGIMSTLAMFWSLPSRILAGTAAAGGAGLVNVGAAVAGFVGPSVMGLLAQVTGSTTIGVGLLAVALFLAGALILTIPRRYLKAGT